MIEEPQYLTVKQFADWAGVSTQRIYQVLDKSLKSYCKEENGKKYISIEGLKLFEKEELQNPAKHLQEVAKDLSNDLQELAKNLTSDLQGTVEGESPQMQLLRETVETLQQQLSAKDAQIAERDKQIEGLTAALKTAQEQAATLTTALTAAQALHAATIQGQLTERIGGSEGASVEVSEEKVSAETVEPYEEPKKRGFFAWLFGKK